MSTNIHTIFLYPKDPLFFRDGRPFSMGEDTSANMLFPPMPSVFYGALCGLIAAHNGITDGKTAKERTKGVTIHSIDLLNSRQTDVGSVSDEFYAYVFPIPLDIIAFKSKKKQTETLQFHTKLGIDSSFFTDYQLKSSKSEKIHDLYNYFLKKTPLTTYLSNGNANFKTATDFLDLLDYTSAEPKIGIGRDKTTYTTSQGKLYRVPMLRTEAITIDRERDNTWTNQQLCFSISFSLPAETNLVLPNDGFVKLGADSKLVRFTCSNNQPSKIEFPKFTDSDQFFKLYLATPAIWNNNTDFAIPNLFTSEAELVAAAVGKAVYVGGFDMAENKPKAMQRAVPAGSVYYFKLKNVENAAQQLQQIVKNTHNKCISDDRAQEGFGRAFIGKVHTKFLTTNSE